MNILDIRLLVVADFTREYTLIQISGIQIRDSPLVENRQATQNAIQNDGFVIALIEYFSLYHEAYSNKRIPTPSTVKYPWLFSDAKNVMSR